MTCVDRRLSLQLLIIGRTVRTHLAAERVNDYLKDSNFFRRKTASNCPPGGHSHINPSLCQRAARRNAPSAPSHLVGVVLPSLLLLLLLLLVGRRPIRTRSSSLVHGFVSVVSVKHVTHTSTPRRLKTCSTATGFRYTNSHRQLGEAIGCKDR